MWDARVDEAYSKLTCRIKLTNDLVKLTIKLWVQLTVDAC